MTVSGLYLEACAGACGHGGVCVCGEAGWAQGLFAGGGWNCHGMATGLHTSSLTATSFET